MNSISNFFYKRSSFLVVIIATSITFAYLFLIFIDKSKCFELENDSVKSLGTSFGFSLENVQAFFTGRTAEMLACYIDFILIWDNIFALLYGFMYVVWLSNLFKPYSTKFKWLNLLPLLQTIFDWLENFKLAQLAKSHLAGNQLLASDVQLASVFTMVKWAFSGIIFLLVMVGVVLLITRAIKKK